MNQQISAADFRKRANRSNRGKALEDAVIASQGNIIRVEKIPNGVKYLPGGKTVAIKSPVDFMGEVVGSGRAIVFDAKKNSRKSGFHFRTYVEAHQVERLYRHAEANAIAGLLLEATHPSIAAFFWLDARDLMRLKLGAGTVLRWHDELLLRLGDSWHPVQFQNIPGVMPEKGAA